MDTFDINFPDNAPVYVVAVVLVLIVGRVLSEFCKPVLECIKLAIENIKLFGDMRRSTNETPGEPQPSADDPCRVLTPQEFTAWAARRRAVHERESQQ